MKQPISFHFSFRRFVGTAVIAGIGLTGSVAVAQEPLPLSQLPLRQDYWNDPQFVANFTGSYGFDSAREPSINSDEKELFDTIVPLIRQNVRLAISTLRNSIVPKGMEGESSAALDFTLGNLYFEAGEYENALRAYNTALEKFPNFARVHKLKGITFVRLGRHKDAIPALAKAIEMGQADGDVYGLIGYCYLTEGKYSPALVAYDQAIIFQPDSKDWKLGKLQCLNYSQRWEEVLALTSEMLGDDVGDDDLWLIQANAYLGLGQVEEAAANYEILRRLGLAENATMFQLGDIYMNEGLFNLAFDVYVEALEKTPSEDPGRTITVAQILTGRGAFDQAQVYIEQIRGRFADSLDDTEEMTLLNLQSRVAMSRGDQETAVRILSQIVERDPLNGEALLQLADYYAGAQDYERAIFRYERAARIPEVQVRALTSHAQMLVGKGDYSDAIPLLRRAQEIRPRDNVGRYLESVRQAANAARAREST